MPTTGADPGPSGDVQAREPEAGQAIEQGRLLDACFAEVGKRIVGQRSMVRGMMMALLAGGHVLLEGMPGLAKTRAVKALAEVADVSFRRLQFTPDLLPADVIGTMVYRPNSGEFVARKGPIFAHIVLADEINRAPAKVQSALLEAMEERQVTLGNETWALDEPFVVLATQNPIEQQGTYPLPEAQLDRFLLKLRVPYPGYEEELAVLRLVGDEQPVALRPLLDRPAIAALRATAARVRVDRRIEEYVVTLMRATRPAAAVAGAADGAAAQPDYLRFVEHGASPRASIYLYRCAKIAALFAGRTFVIPEDVKAVAADVLRHRLVPSYEGESEGVTAEQVIEALLAHVQVP